MDFEWNSTYLTPSGSFSLIVLSTLISNRAASRYFSTFLIIFNAKRVAASLKANNSINLSHFIHKFFLTHEDHELPRLFQMFLRRVFVEFHLIKNKYIIILLSNSHPLHRSQSNVSELIETSTILGYKSMNTFSLPMHR